MQLFHLKNLRKGRQSIPGMYYLITKCCYKRECLLIPNLNDFRYSSQMYYIFKFSIVHLERHNIWRPIAFVMMPNHFHLIFQLGDKKTLSQAVGSLTSFVFREYQKRNKEITKLWQKNYHDHVIRNQKSLDNLICYVAENPIRKGLVKDVDSWPFTIIRE